MVKGDGRPGRGRATAEEDDDEYNSRMEFPPDDVIAVFEHQQVKQDKIWENICAAGAAGSMHGSRICRSGRVYSSLLWVRTEVFDGTVDGLIA